MTSIPEQALKIVRLEAIKCRLITLCGRNFSFGTEFAKGRGRK
jgi:hypothetical protein